MRTKRAWRDHTEPTGPRQRHQVKRHLTPPSSQCPPPDTRPHLLNLEFHLLLRAPRHRGGRDDERASDVHDGLLGHVLGVLDHGSANVSAHEDGGLHRVERLPENEEDSLFDRPVRKFIESWWGDSWCEQGEREDIRVWDGKQGVRWLGTSVNKTTTLATTIDMAVATACDAGPGINDTVGDRHIRSNKPRI